MGTPAGLKFLGPFAVSLGSFGVDIFFAISGFLITTLLLDEYALTNRISLRSFYIRRAFRILPPAVLFLAVMGALSLVTWKDIVKCLFFLANYAHLDSDYVGHFWSLSVEEHFYLLWPISLVFFRPKGAVLFGTAAFVLVGFWRVMIHPSVGWAINHRTDGRLDAFFAPCVLAILLHRKAITFPSWIAPGALLAILVTWFFSKQSMVLTDVQKSLESVLIAVMVIATTRNASSIISRVLEFPVLRFIGKMSYSLYIWQEPFAYWNLPAWVAVPAMFGCAWLSYRIVEQPLMSYGRKLAGATAVPVLNASRSAISGRL